MTRADPTESWTPRLGDESEPVYRAIARALEADIRVGRLEPGDPLPPQRELAERLGVNFTTVTRAYAEARRRGLITATVGRGTFVAEARARAARVGEAGGQDLSVNAPPVPRWMPGAFRSTVVRIGADAVLAHNTLSYASRLGDVEAREAGARWLEGRGLQPSPERIVATAGAQHALSLLLSTLARPGDAVLVEALAYPGLQGAAAAAAVRLVGVDIDDEGVRPDALDAACARHAPKALFCVPTLQNPTTAVMSPGRQRDVIDVARRHSLRIVEDDICGPLFPDATPLAALAPESVVYVGSLSKCVAPGLRTAFVLAPTPDEAVRLGAAVRASVLMLSPLPLAVASAWIADGTAQRAAADIRTEAAARGELARRIFGEASVSAPPGSLHAWLRLPSTWTVAAFVAQAQQHGVRVAPADWYLMPAAEDRAPAPPAAVRLSLGAEPDRAQLERALRTVAGILDQPVALRASSL